MIFDAHGDILTNMYWEYLKTSKLDSFKRLHYDKYLAGGITGSIFVNFTDPGVDNEEIFADIFEVSLKELEANKDILKLCLNTKDYQEALHEQRIGVFLGVEGLAFLRDIHHLQKLYDLGLRHAAITWNEENKYGGGIRFPDAGLTEAGVLLVQELEKLGVVIDLAHANSKTFTEILKIVKRPVIVSHANCRTLCDNPRNLTDEQLQEIKKNGGVIGVTAVANFISKEKGSKTVTQLARHIDYAVKLIGIEHVGIGLDVCHYLDDLYTDTRVKGLEDIDRAPNILSELRKLGYSEIDIEKIAYGNFLRILKVVLD